MLPRKFVTASMPKREQISIPISSDCASSLSVWRHEKTARWLVRSTTCSRGGTPGAQRAKRMTATAIEKVGIFHSLGADLARREEYLRRDGRKAEPAMHRGVCGLAGRPPGEPLH
jgi:hypothetical protein